MGYFEWKVELELRKLNALKDCDLIQNIEWFPLAPFNCYHCAVRINNKVEISKDLTFDEGLICSISFISNYINVIFKLDCLREIVVQRVLDEKDKYGFTKTFSGCKVAIEHTSMTTVYPLNVATFRGSVLGDAFVRLLKNAGAEVEVHYLVEDRARQLELLEKAYRVAKNKRQLSYCKCDHLCGGMFTAAYFESKQKRVDTEIIGRMFPDVKGFNFSEVVNFESNLPVTNIYELCDFCLAGHKETLRNANIQTDFFDYESKSEFDINYAAFKNKDDILELLQTHIKTPYFLRNAIYFASLKKGKDEVYTILPGRQRETFNETKEMLNENTVYPVFFGDVLITDDDEQEAYDCIKDGIFHSVDTYLDDVSRLYNRSTNDILSALKLKLLSIRSNQACVVDDKEPIQYQKFFSVFDAYNSLLTETPNANSNSSSERTLSVIKLLIQWETVIQRLFKDKDFSRVVDYALKLGDEIIGIKENPSCIDGLKRALLITLNNVFDLLGVRYDG